MDNRTNVKLRVGVSQVDITPWANVQVAGAVGVRRKAKTVLDPLFAKAMVLDNGQTKLCLVSGDLTVVTREASDRIRDLAVVTYGFDRDAIIVHMTQTHTAPAMGHFFFDSEFKNIPEKYNWLRGGDQEYTEFVIEEIVKAIGLAEQNCTPVEIGFTWAIEGRLAFNRRSLRKDGTVGMPTRTWQDARGNHDFVCLEGPIDPQVLMMCFRSPNLKIPAVLLNYSCHPVHVFPKQLISADWPGSWCKGIRELLGTGCVPLVINGCCGNINPWDPWDPDYANDHERMGQILTKRCEDALEFIEFDNSDLLSYRSTHLKIPYRQIPEDKLSEAQKYLEKNPEILWRDDTKTQVDPEWFQHASLFSLYLEINRERAMDYEIQVWRVGDAAIVALPGEPFVEGQLEIKLNSPAKFTFIMHMSSHYVGYIPTYDAMKRVGHETKLSSWSKLAPEALDTIVKETGKLLREIFP